MSYVKNNCLTQGHKLLWLCFLLRVSWCWNLHLGLWSISSKFIYIVWGRGPNSFFCIFSWPSTIFWKDSFLLKCLVTLVKNLSKVNVRVYFCTMSSTPVTYKSILKPASHCFDWCDFMESLRSVTPPNLFLFFSIVLAIVRLLYFHMNSTVILLISTRQPARILMRLAFTIDQFKEYCHLKILSFNPQTWDIYLFI